MADYSKIAVLGAGAWGTALAAAFSRGGHDVRLWGRDEAVIGEIRIAHSNTTYIPGANLPETLVATTDLRTALSCADIVLFVTPAQSTRALAMLVKGDLPAGVPLIACAKGIEKGTGELQTETLGEILPGHPVGALSGPSFAADVARGLPTAVVLAMDDEIEARRIASALSSGYLRLYASDDVRGVQIGGALKNVIAIAVGICRGGKLGASAEAALVARGYAEIQRVGAALGMKAETLNGLSGLGDLFLTCSSTLSRNFSYGIAIGEGRDLTGMKLAEGVHTVGIACEIARKHGIDVPICETAQAILSGRISVREAQAALMARPVKSES